MRLDTRFDDIERLEQGAAAARREQDQPDHGGVSFFEQLSCKQADGRHQNALSHDNALKYATVRAVYAEFRLSGSSSRGKVKLSNDAAQAGLLGRSGVIQ